MRNLLATLTPLSLAMAAPAFAAQPEPWGFGFQPAASPVAAEMAWFHNILLMPIITGICIFVLLLLIIVVVRFNRHVNKTPSQTTHNVPLEIAWTVIPIVILIIIAVPSFKLLYFTERTAQPEMTLKVKGYQWYWGFEYPDQEIAEFQSYMIPEADAKANPDKYVRLLSTDNVVVLPVDTNIQILVTAADVIHSLALPAFGLKKDAVPGRTNETWVRITKPGTYYGQCSEICGTGHAYMPIEIRAVSKEEFKQWAALAKDDLEAAYKLFEEGVPTAALIPNQSDTAGE